MKISRTWAMPDADTFSISPIKDFVRSYFPIRGSDPKIISVDPFARNKRIATWTNDINPTTAADHHMDAVEFLGMLKSKGVKANLVILDPPYSPRQISECYKAFGIPCGMKETQNSVFYKRIRDAVMGILMPHSTVLSFGWNSSGMGSERGFKQIEIMLCCHGGAHNDTICLAERLIVPHTELDL